MARKPLMHNYIYFETLEVGPKVGRLEHGVSGVDRRRTNGKNSRHRCFELRAFYAGNWLEFID